MPVIPNDRVAEPFRPVRWSLEGTEKKPCRTGWFCEFMPLATPSQMGEAAPDPSNQLATSCY